MVRVFDGLPGGTSCSFKRLILLIAVSGTVLSAASTKRFRDYRDYELTGTPEAMVTADVNRDGVPDAVVATAGGVDVLLGKADGSFTSPIVVDTSFKSSVAVGDFNGDGAPDIASVIGTPNGPFIILAYGNGNGGFSKPRIIPHLCTSCVITAADFNQDGKLDLAVANLSGVEILLGDGKGNFGLVPLAIQASFCSRSVRLT